MSSPSSVATEKLSPSCADILSRIGCAAFASVLVAVYVLASVSIFGRSEYRCASSVPAKPSLHNVYRHRRTAARDRRVRRLSCEIVICGIWGVNAWITTSPRASDAMKFGSPAYISRAAAGVTFGFVAAAGAEGAGAESVAVVIGFRGRND